ncbi:lipoprotein-anchoring transpeptidase ErfK/SrfK [Desulfohalotomaculum tongense]|uniref:L,D-transpeptidase family protein n=1 Tax=Desulforadius tongensis TaxID=1216062 RepID=UPI00195E0128|nr:L,D-transpeptidase family protein [Desulforadius tongensis]MBM7855588.1 lipoprotein-anchoring transpeptidase ErfK/SrfK [Desulforadius tongensis]
MKKKIFSFSAIIILLIIAVSYLPQSLESTAHQSKQTPEWENKKVEKNTGQENGTAETSDPLAPERILAMVKPSIVVATITKSTKVYSNYTTGQVSGQLAEGDKVEVFRDRGYQWYYVKNLTNNLTGWIPAEPISIPADPATNQNKMNQKELETFVNLKGFQSDTNYLVWVDIDRQLVHVFTGTLENWKLQKSMDCATGKNISPTLRGSFTIKERGTWFYSPQFQSGAKYWVRYSGAYLFHTVAMDKNQQIKDPTLGKRASNGCIRLAVEDAKWFYDTIPRGTKVFVN